MPTKQTADVQLRRHLREHSKEVAVLMSSLKSLDQEIRRREFGQGTDPNPKPDLGIGALGDQRHYIELQIQRHQTLIELGHNEKVLRVLDGFLRNPALVAKAADNPRAYAAARGIELPITMDIELGQDDGHPYMRVTNFDRLAPFTLYWDASGFSFPS